MGEPWYRIGGTDDIDEARRWALQARIGLNIVLYDTVLKQALVARVLGKNRSLNHWIKFNEQSNSRQQDFETPGDRGKTSKRETPAQEASTAETSHTYESAA